MDSSIVNPKTDQKEKICQRIEMLFYKAHHLESLGQIQEDPKLMESELTPIKSFELVAIILRP